jgi:segregation and condensation protein A
MTAPCTVKLDVFEGPLDLLLHLIKKNEVQIVDIPIATITDQYLAALEAAPELLNLDGAGEYLVMAATLMYIKSRMLLPMPDDGEEEAEEDPRAALVQQLLEYQRFREVAVALGERSILEREVFPHPGEAVETLSEGEMGTPPVRDASLADLLAALRDVLGRAKPPRPHEVPHPELSVGQCVARILARFTLDVRVEFTTLFAPEADRGEIIATFLALLELIRLKVVRTEQAERFGPIWLLLAVADLAEASARVREVEEWEAWRGGERPHGDGSAANS